MEARSPARGFFRWLLAVFFVVAGANHFRVPSIYVAMIPPWLPWPAALNAISGACEILGCLGRDPIDRQPPSHPAADLDFA